MASAACGVPAMRHQPLPDNASVQARFWHAQPDQEVGNGLGPFPLLEPHATQLAANPLVHLAEVCSDIPHGGSTSPSRVRNELSSPIICSKLMPRLRRVICRMRSLARSRLLGAIASVPLAEQPVAEELAFLHGGHRALLAVDAQPQLAFQELR